MLWLLFKIFFFLLKNILLIKFYKYVGGETGRGKLDPVGNGNGK